MLRGSPSRSRPKKCTVQTLSGNLSLLEGTLRSFGLTLTDISGPKLTLILNPPQSLQNSGCRFALGISLCPTEGLFWTFPAPSPTQPSHNPSLSHCKPSPKEAVGKSVRHCICSSSYCFLNYSSIQTTNGRMSYNTPCSILSQVFRNSQNELGWHYYFYYSYYFWFVVLKLERYHNETVQLLPKTPRKLKNKQGISFHLQQAVWIIKSSSEWAIFKQKAGNV